MPLSVVGLVFCHGAHTREETGTCRRGRKLKITVFNDIRARQGKADRQEHRGVTSRPDDTKLNRQELKYTR